MKFYVYYTCMSRSHFENENDASFRTKITIVRRDFFYSLVYGSADRKYSESKK
jgi:hypothetical protein